MLGTNYLQKGKSKDPVFLLAHLKAVLFEGGKE